MSILSDYKKSATIFIYATCAFVLISLWLVPKLAGPLAYEDGPVETLTALLFLLSSVVIAVRSIQALKDKSNNTIAIMGLVVAVAFFVFAGEEISWGQRIFNIETGEFMQQYNWQGEVNLHNLHTDLFNIAFHYGALIFLIILPLFRTRIIILLKKFNLDVLKYFIAPTWLALPSFVFLGMLDPRFIYVIEAPWVAVIYLLSLAIGLGLLLFTSIQLIRSEDKTNSTYLFISLLLIGLGLFVSYLQAIDKTPNNISEYKELVIAIGLFMFAFLWRPDHESENKLIA